MENVEAHFKEILKILNFESKFNYNQIKLLKASIVFTFFLPSLATIPRSPVSINLSFETN